MTALIARCLRGLEWIVAAGNMQRADAQMLRDRFAIRDRELFVHKWRHEWVDTLAIRHKAGSDSHAFRNHSSVTPTVDGRLTIDDWDR